MRGFADSRCRSRDSRAFIERHNSGERERHASRQIIRHGRERQCQGRTTSARRPPD